MRKLAMDWICHSLLTVFILSVLSVPAAYSASLTDVTQCAVYHRMVASDLSRNRNLDSIADIEKDKMFTLMSRARAIAADEYGEEEAEDMFQEEWRYHINDMMNRIDRNYAHMYRLRSRYKERCEKMSDPDATEPTTDSQ